MSCLPRLARYIPVFLFIIGYYYWQSSRTDNPWEVWNIWGNAPGQVGGYGDLSDAFIHHSLALLNPVDPKLALAANPYDPASRAHDALFFWDYSYYQGKYYLYFGPVPALLIGCPWHFLFGYLPTRNVTLFLINLANVALFFVLVRLLAIYYFPRISAGFECVILVAYSFSNLLPFLMSRPEMYEIAIASGALFTLAFFVALLVGLQHESRRWLAFGLASLSAGLAAGSRPTTIFLLVFLAVGWAFLNRRRLLGPAALKELAALAIPAVLCVTALLGYNYARFGSIFQFGNRYLMNYGDVYFHPNFELRNIPDGLWAYYVQPWHMTWEFPCIGLGSQVGPPAAIFLPDRTRELSSGLLCAAPLILVGTTWWWYARKLAGNARRTLLLFGGLLSAWSVFFGLLISAFFAVTTRYEVELQLPLLMLMTLALLARRNLGPFKAWEGVCFILLFQVTCYVGFAFGLIGENDWMVHYLHPGP